MKKSKFTICEKCFQAKEPPVFANKKYIIPENCCRICYIRYGKVIPATRKEEKREGKK